LVAGLVTVGVEFEPGLNLMGKNFEDAKKLIPERVIKRPR